MSRRYDKLKKLDHRYLWHPFTQMQEWMAEDPCIIVEGQGSYVMDVHGRKYLDGVSSLWCNLFGHRRPELDRALKAQADRIAHSTFLGLSHEPGIELAARLMAIVPPGLQRVFYSDSGATAVEVALKIAMQYWQLKGQTDRKRFACLSEAYHGDTVGAMSVGYSEMFHRYHKPLLFPTLQLTPPHLYRTRERIGEEKALEKSIAEARLKLSAEKEALVALIVEPVIQGAAGMWPQPPGYVKALREICRDCDILFIADEVATGFGHTGRMFACEHEEVSPDLLCVGKGLTGGYLPLAATFTTEEIFAAFLGDYTEFKTLFHGHTYTGNPLGCAVALAGLDLFEKERVLEKLQPKIAYIQSRLLEDFLPLPHVGDVRQRGFMIGIELVLDKESLRPYAPETRIGHKVILEARRRGVIIRPLGNVLILLPPLTMSQAELETLLNVVHDSLREVTGDS